MPKLLSEKDRPKIAELLKRGLTYLEVGNRAGCSEETARQFAHKYGLTSLKSARDRKRAWTDERKAMLRAAIDAKVPAREMARQFGVHVETICGAAKRFFGCTLTGDECRTRAQRVDDRMRSLEPIPMSPGEWSGVRQHTDRLLKLLALAHPLGAQDSLVSIATFAREGMRRWNVNGWSGQ